ncbi:fluoride efflux transporter CrcB [Candidatus Micrarchaeota archaeon]|nr:fluoride efflux transporter CrcB [Candidatus Micrarchaeota archaeon]
MNPLWLVAIGGGIGAAARVAVANLFGSGSFPLGILLVNVFGSFLLGLLVFLGDGAVSPDLRQFAGAGVLGGFTTFSTFSVDTFRLFEEQQWALAFGNVVLSVALSLLGILLAKLAAGVMAPA